MFRFNDKSKPLGQAFAESPCNPCVRPRILGQRISKVHTDIYRITMDRLAQRL